MCLLAFGGLLVATAAFGQAPHVDARSALRAGELDLALRLARQAVAAKPDDADALGVLGLVEWKRGDAADALGHFDAAIAHSGATPSAALLSNRGASLSALGRYAEAERAFLDAAARATPPLDALSVLNAGFAALDAGSDQRAREHLTRARALDREQALDAELKDLAAELDAHAEELYLAGIAAYQRGQRDEAEAQLSRARALGLDAERSAIAADYLELIAGGLWLSGRGLHAELELAAGYDSNAVQAGLADSNPLLVEAQTEHGAPYGQLRGEVAYGFSPEDAAFVIARYDFEQLAYTASALDVFNWQQHALTLEGEQRFGKDFRLGALARGSFEAAGLADLRAFSAGVRGDVAAMLEHGNGLRTRFVPSLSHTAVIDPAFASLSGTRVELTLEESYARGRLRAYAALSYRFEMLGTQRVATTLPEGSCDDCDASYVIPLAYRGPRAALWASYRLLDDVRATARVAGELRLHGSATYLAVQPEGEEATRLAERVEHDARLSLRVGFTVELSEPIELEVDYDVTVAGSNIDNTLGGDHVLDYANLAYVRHIVSLGVATNF